MHDRDGRIGRRDALRMALGLGAVPAVVLLIGMLLLPDTPAYLLRRNRRDRALKVLRDMHGPRAELSDVEIAEGSMSDGQRAAERAALKVPWCASLITSCSLAG